MAGLAAMILDFSLLSYYPPRFTLSEDSRTGEYGIPSSDGRKGE